MNPIIYMGTQAKYRLAISLLFCREKQIRKGRESYRKSSISEVGPANGGAKFYVRQISSSTDQPETEELQNLNNKNIKNGKNLKRQVSFRSN